MGSMLFSKRHELAMLAETWCTEHNVPIGAFNITTALEVLGALRKPEDRLRWSDDAPTEAGWYWWRHSPVTRARMLQVFEYSDNLLVSPYGILQPLADLLPCQWAGPEPEPDEPGEEAAT